MKSIYISYCAMRYTCLNTHSQQAKQSCKTKTKKKNKTVVCATSLSGNGILSKNLSSHARCVFLRNYLLYLPIKCVFNEI